MIPNNFNMNQHYKINHPPNDQRIISNPFQHYHKQNNKILIKNNPEIQISPRININEYKVQFNQIKHQFLPIEKLTNRFTKINPSQHINTVKSTIMTDNRNFKTNFQPGTLASMARFIPQSNTQNIKNNQQKNSTLHFNDNNFNMKRLEKSPMILPKYTKQNQQKTNVYRSFIYPSVNQRMNQRKTEVNIQDIRKKYQIHVNNNSKQKSKQDSQKIFFNKYAAAKIQQNKFNYKQTQRTNYTKRQNQYVKNPSQKKLISQPITTLKKDLSSHLLTQNTTKDAQKYEDFHEQLKKFKQDHFSTTTNDTPIKQKKFFKPVFFKNTKLATHSDNKILNNYIKVPIYDLTEHKKSQTYIKRTISQIQIMDQSFSFDQQHKNKLQEKKWNIDDFQISDKLGKGAFGDVFIARQKNIGFICVIKKMSKKRIKQQQRQQHVLRQLKIQSYLTHSHLASLYGFFDDKQHIYLVIEYLSDGNLSQIKKNRKTSQKQTANILHQICEGLSYMHNLQIIHRDIKPQNIFVNQNFLKIGDFGCSVFTDKLRKTIVSCLQYSSPQQLNNQYYNQKIDVWGIGILAYELLTGKSPYQAQLMGKLKQNDQIDFSNLKYPQNSNISSIAKDFIAGLLNTNPLDRLNIFQALDHEFIRSNIIISIRNISQNHVIQQIQQLLKN